MSPPHVRKSMKAIALAISMILILVPLAGCSGTDTEVSVDLSNEDINELIDENLEDVMNNTTVVVFQEYYNNTTVVNHYSNNSTTNTDQSGTSTTTYNYNGSASEPEIFVLRLEWDSSSFTSEIENKRDNDFTVTYSYYDYATNDDRTDEFTLACSNYYDVVVPGEENESSYSYWESSSYYWDWWDNIYNNTIRNLLDEFGYSSEVQDSCRNTNYYEGLLIDSDDYYLDNNVYDYSNAPVFHQMSIPNGTALKIVQITGSHYYTQPSNWGGNYEQTSIEWTVNSERVRGCTDHSSIVNWQSCGGLYGGWEDITLEFQIISRVWEDSEFTFSMYYELIPVSN